MEERTPNMFCMIVTLEVSKLSGWLNAFADCRESRTEGIHGAGRGSGREAAGGRQLRRMQRVRGRARLQTGGRAWGVKRT